MYRNNAFPNFMGLIRHRPQAIAEIKGNGGNSQISGTVKFYQTEYGVVVVAELHGLPASTGICTSPIFAFHIHEGMECTGNMADPFSNAKTHYNPHNCPHPYHAGDLPPLFGAKGYAFSAFLTNRFRVSEIIGRTAIVHSSPDDFTTQPSGNAGEKLACGKIAMV